MRPDCLDWEHDADLYVHSQCGKFLADDTTDEIAKGPRGLHVALFGVATPQPKDQKLVLTEAEDR